MQETLPGFWRTALLVARKDMRVEFRNREILYLTAFFAVTCVLVLAFSFGEETTARASVAAGILWIAIAFAGTLALGPTFERERYNDTLRALLLAPAPPAAIYVGKLMGTLCVMSAVEVGLVPLTALLFQVPLVSRAGAVALLLAGGTLGFAAVGTLCAAMLARSRSRQMLLPIVLYPLTLPVIIAGVGGTVALLNPDNATSMASFWLYLVLTFDVVFLTLSLWIFEPLMKE